MLIAYLGYLREQLIKFRTRFLSEEVDANKILSTVDDYTRKVMTVLCYKIVYCDFAEKVFNKLYFIGTRFLI